MSSPENYGPQVDTTPLRDLLARVNELVNFAIQDGDELVFVERMKTSSQVVNVNLRPGSHLPLYNTSLGRALISEMPLPWPKPASTIYEEEG